MSDEQIPLDLRALADIDSPEVVRVALRTFRRRMLTRYVWVALAIVFAALALIASGRPSDLREEIEQAHTRSYPANSVWRVSDASIALAEVADLGDAVGLHFVLLPDPGKGSPGIWVHGEIASMKSGSYDTYLKLPKISGDTLEVTIGPERCLPNCSQQSTITIVFRQLMVPRNVWRSEA